MVIMSISPIKKIPQTCKLGMRLFCVKYTLMDNKKQINVVDVSVEGYVKFTHPDNWLLYELGGM